MTETLQETQKAAEFSRLLLESIDESLTDVLSQRVSNDVFVLMETRFGIKRDDLPQRIRDFENHITVFFGAAAPVLIRLFVRNLCAKLQIPYRQEPDYNLQMYLEDCIRRWKEIG